MAVVRFTQNLQRHVASDACCGEGGTVAEVLFNVFAKHPVLKGYILDDQGAVRKHVAVFVDGEPVVDRATLTDTVGPEDEIFVLQALSGG